MPIRGRQSSIHSIQMGPQRVLLLCAHRMGGIWLSCPIRSAASWAGSCPGPLLTPRLLLMGPAPGYASSRMHSPGAKPHPADAYLPQPLTVSFCCHQACCLKLFVGCLMPHNAWQISLRHITSERIHHLASHLCLKLLDAGWTRRLR